MLSQMEEKDVLLIGSGVMSAHLGVLLKCLDSSLSIELFEVTEEFALESSNGWNNAGTGHAGICELSYTPNRGEDGEVVVEKAIKIFEEFEQSKQFWAYALKAGMIDHPEQFISSVPHVSFVYGQEQVDFLKSRFRGMSKHPFFHSMQYSENREKIRKWAPLLVEGRREEPIAATYLESGTDVNFGVLSRKLIEWLTKQDECCAHLSHQVTDLRQRGDFWEASIRDLKKGVLLRKRFKFVFVGAGGGSLPLLQKAGIPEIHGYGGFPIGGQWLVCHKPEIVSKHHAKVYGLSPGAAPTMAVPHLDSRVLENKRALLFGPYAAWTTKFLHGGGSYWDLFASLRWDNWKTLMKVGLANLPLVSYLMQQGLQGMDARMRELRNFYPDAKLEDWKLTNAGIRVQVIKKEDGDAGIVHFGTEVVTSEDRSLASLLGASPGASVCVNVVLEVVQKCFFDLLKKPRSQELIREMIPTLGFKLSGMDEENEGIANFRAWSQSAESKLGLIHKSTS